MADRLVARWLAGPHVAAAGRELGAVHQYPGAEPTLPAGAGQPPGRRGASRPGALSLSGPRHAAPDHGSRDRPALRQLSAIAPRFTTALGLAHNWRQAAAPSLHGPAG